MHLHVLLATRRPPFSPSRPVPDNRPIANLTRAQALDVARTFPTLAKSFANKLTGNFVAPQQLESLFQYAIDIACAHGGG